MGQHLLARTPAPTSPARSGIDRRRLVDQRLHDPPRLLDRVLADEVAAIAVHRAVQQLLIRCRALAALFGEVHVQVHLVEARTTIGFLLCSQMLAPGWGPTRSTRLLGSG